MCIDLLSINHLLGSVKDAGDLKTNEHNWSCFWKQKKDSPLECRDWEEWLESGSPQGSLLRCDEWQSTEAQKRKGMGKLSWRKWWDTEARGWTDTGQEKSECLDKWWALGQPVPGRMKSLCQGSKVRALPLTSRMFVWKKPGVRWERDRKESYR